MEKYEDILTKLSAFPSWSPTNESAVLEPFTYITSNPGKEIRSQLIDAFNLWLDVPAQKLAVISRLVNMLHAASLLVDDIEDDSQLRRGQPVAHKIYGVPQTINTANYVFFLAYQELFALRSQDPSESGMGGRGLGLDAIVNEELLSLHRGQGLELLWRDSLRCPTEEEYISMVNNTQWPVLLQSYTKNKGFAEDLTEGKFSFPVVHSIHADTSNRQVLNVLQKRPATPTLKNHTIEYLRRHTKSFEYTHKVLESLERQTREEIRRLGGNTKLEAIMDLLSVPKEEDS
ncbi:hypothetical protein DXG01_003273 [Tephrocybe rancida]|nr:hypothetical protein DXG01_003273 [Tephrocybe rancida]